MSYTIADIDTFVEYVEDENGESGWHNFAEGVENTKRPKRNPDGSYVRDGGGWTVYEPLENPGVTIPGIGQAVLVEDFGGEGQGDQYWFVFKITDEAGDTRTFQRLGWYQSFNGGEYDGPTIEVKPVEKTITVWEEAK